MMSFIVYCFAWYGAYLIFRDLSEKKCDSTCDDENLKDEDFYHE